MNHYIVHRGTGTVIAASECVIVDVPDEVIADIIADGGDDYFDDARICELAERTGRIVQTDLFPNNCVAFSPSAIRDELAYMIDRTDDDDSDRPMLVWAHEQATELELVSMADWILGADDFWDNLGLTRWIRDAVRNAYQQRAVTA